MFYRKHILKDIKPGKNNNFAIGAAFHKVLECMANKPNLTATQCKTIFTETAFKDRSYEGFPEPVLELVPVVNLYYHSGKRLFPWMLNNKPMTEVWFNFLVDDDLFVNGKIDIITEKKNVVDYKFTKSAKVYKNVDLVNKPLEGEALALSLYGAACETEFKFSPKVVGFQTTIKSAIGSEDIENYPYKWDSAITPLVLEYVKECHSQFKTNKYPKTEGNCRFCDYKANAYTCKY
jgi:hypothetical protein